MGKRNRSSNQKVIDRRLKAGRGKGRGEDYDPYLHIQDVASIGLAVRDKGWKTNRVHHFLSSLEWFYFLKLEWARTVIDIREQYPLDLDETMAIAKSLGIAYPVDTTTKEPIVMTTDLVYTTKTSLRVTDHARTVKYAQDLSDLRVMEKFEIERVYWTIRNITWRIVTERNVNPSFTFNVRWLHRYR